MLKNKRTPLTRLSFIILAAVWLGAGLGCSLINNISLQIKLFPSPTATATPTIKLTATLHPTLTPLPTNTRRPTLTITPTATIPPTPIAIESPSLHIVDSSAPPRRACFSTNENGLTCLNQEGWVSYTSSNSPLEEAPIRSLSVCPDQRLLVTQNDNIQIFDGLNWQKVSPDLVDPSLSAICDPSGGIWVMHAHAISHFDSKQWITFTPEKITGQNDPAEILQDIALGPGEAVWAITNSRLMSYNGSDWKVIDPGGSLHGKYAFTNITVDANGDPWIASPAYLFNYSQGSWKQVYQQALPSANSLLIDLQQRIWISTNFGLFIFQNGDWYVIDADKMGLSSAAVHGLAFDRAGRLWVGTAWGLNIFDGQKWTAYHMDNSMLIDNQILGVAVIDRGPDLPPFLTKPGGNITGRLLSEGLPLDAVNIELCVEPLGSIYTGKSPCSKQPFSRTTTTNGLGDFIFKSLPVGRYQIIMELGEGNWTPLETETGETRFVLVSPGRKIDLGSIAVTVKPAPPSLTLTVTDTPTPDP